ncbi:hypothetical protein L0Y69_01220, partial [bacterium]|nr:hypothetical protein [bacterium]
ESALQEKIFRAGEFTNILEKKLREMIERVRILIERFSQGMVIIRERITNIKTIIPKTSRRVAAGFLSLMQNSHEKISSLEKILAAENPERQLKLGWSIAFSRGKVVRSVVDVHSGDPLDVKVSDGTIRTTVQK